MKRGHLYFAQVDGGGPVKIGWTCGSIYDRIRQLQWASPYVLNWIGATPAPKSREGDCHRELSDYRVRSEWFHPVKPVLDLMRRECGDFNPADYIYHHIGPLQEFRALTGCNTETFDRACKTINVSSWDLAAWRDRGRALPEGAIEKLRQIMPDLRQAS